MQGGTHSRGLLALVVGIVGALVGSFAPAAAHAASTHKYPTLEAAVAAGALDQAVVDELRSSGRAHVLIRVHDSSGAAGALAPMKAEVSSRADEVIRIHAHVPFVDAAVRSEDSLLDVLDDAATERVAAPHELQKSLQESLPLIRQPQALALGASGAGTGVAVLDTGVDYTRPEFGSCQAAGAPGCRVAFSVDVGNDDGFLDDDGHGTNVSAIVLGVAPSTKLYVYDVFQGSSGSTDDLVTALDDVLTRQQQGANIRSVNLSLGSGPDPSCSGPGGIGDPGFAQLRAAGVVPVVASGNDKNANVIAWPACISSAIAVGATYDANVGPLSYQVGCTDGTTFVDKIACFSNSGPGLDMLAPGALITAGGSTLAGTSQATPHVAGAIAVVGQAWPNASTAAVVDAVVTQGPLVLDTRNNITRHRLDLEAAVKFIRTNSLGGVVTADPDATRRSSGRLDVVARGVDDAVYFREAAGTDLAPWASLGGAVQGGPAVVSMDGNRLDVFARAYDNALWTRSWDGTWGPWTSLGGFVTSDPAAASWSAGRMDVFVRGGDNQLYHRWYLNGAWFPWEPLGGVLASSPAAVSWGVNRVDILATGTDGGVWQQSWADGWTGWSSLGGITPASPSVTSPAPGRLDAFVQGTDARLWVRTFLGGWGPWRPIGSPLVGGPAAVSNARYPIEVVVRLSDNTVGVRISQDGVSVL